MHSLEIERGRYRNIDVSDRKCTFCSKGSVEDELHFIFDCPLYEDKRRLFNNKINTLNLNYTLLSQKDKLFWLMSNEDDLIIKEFSSYINTCFEIRRNSYPYE